MHLFRDIDLNPAKQNDITTSFFEWDNIVQWIDTQVKINENLQKIVIAKTYEQRDIFMLKISNGKKKPIVFIVGGEEGKDWMSSAIILNLIMKLLKESDTNNSLFQYFDFYLVPILNPDGLVYSKKTVNI